MFEGLKVTTDSSGIITSIAQSTPATYLNTEAEFAFVLSPAGIPASGTVTYKNNLQRSMKRDEVTLHFRQIGGPNAVWDYYAQHGKTVSYPPTTASFPRSVREGFPYNLCRREPIHRQALFLGEQTRGFFTHH